MRVEIERSVLKKALGKVARVVATRAQLPMLANVLLGVEKEEMRITAASLEMGMEVVVGAKVMASGKAAVPAKVLSELVGNLGGEKVVLSAEGLKLKLEAEGGRLEIMGMDPGEFPAVTGFPKRAVLEVERRVFLGAMREVGFAAASDESRPVLSAVLIRGMGDQVEVVATDGFRLSRKVIGASPVLGMPNMTRGAGASKGRGRVKGRNGEEGGRWLVPARAMMEVSKLAEEGGGEAGLGAVRIGVVEEKNQIVFGVGQAILCSRLVEGEFPDYQKIIPKSWTSRVVMEKEEIFRVLKMVAVFARESANVVKFGLGRRGVRLVGESAVLGKGEGRVAAKLEGEEVEVAFNFRYVLDFLGAVRGEEVVLELSGALAPGVWKVEGEEDWLQVIMPVRLQGNKT